MNIRGLVAVALLTALMSGCSLVRFARVAGTEGPTLPSSGESARSVVSSVGVKEAGATTSELRAGDRSLWYYVGTGLQWVGGLAIGAGAVMLLTEGVSDPVPPDPKDKFIWIPQTAMIGGGIAAFLLGRWVADR